MQETVLGLVDVSERIIAVAEQCWGLGIVNEVAAMGIATLCLHKRTHGAGRVPPGVERAISEYAMQLVAPAADVARFFEEHPPPRVPGVAYLRHLTRHFHLSYRFALSNTGVMRSLPRQVGLAAGACPYACEVLLEALRPGGPSVFVVYRRQQ
jgi:hypothetical protein